jgi:zinc protease
MKYRVIVASLLLVSSAPVLGDQSLLKQSGRWAQDYTGRKADPSVRFGTLANGVRYAIMHNETPSDGVAMRMRIGAGSLQEREDEQGLAHYLEHMAFRGSTNVPDGEVVHMLQRQGLQFGPDTNANTGQDETVYMFNFPKADQTALGTGLTLFREIGERLNLAPQAIDAERGVILSEERLRDTPPYRMIKSNFGTILDGTRAVSRWPIGKVETIKAANHDRLSRFYRANYRPDNATIVVVGNIDPAAVEQQIRSRFSDWKPAGTPDRIDLGAPSGKKPIGEFVDPGAPDQLSLNWVRPDDPRADTDAFEREEMVRQVALTVLNQRLSDRALKPGSAFVGAQAQRDPSVLHSASLVILGITTTPEKWHDALDAVSAEQRMLVRDGVQPGELKRAISTIRTQLQAKAAAASTRKSPDIANEIVNVVNEEHVDTSDAQDLAFFGPMLDKLSKPDVDAALRSMFSDNRPILFRSARQSAAGETQLASALTSAYSRALGAQVQEAAITWPYTSFGKPSPVVGTSVDAKLGLTTVRFANGTRLLVKPTKYEKDRVRVAVSFGNGRAGVTPGLAHALWETQLYPLAGTGKLALGDIAKWLQTTGKVASVSLEPGTRSFVLKGVTRPADLSAQMELLAAYARDPGFRTEAVEKARQFAPMMSGQIEGNAGAVYIRGAQALTVGNDRRFAELPSASDLAHVSPSDLPDLLRQPLSGQADVVIVGDVTVPAAIKATEATFAAGPARRRVEAAAPHITIAEAKAPAVFEHKGRADQAFYGEYFVLPDYFADPKTSAAADVTAAILSARLVDTVREKLGMTYSPMVNAGTSLELKGQGYFTAAIETPQANFNAFHALLAEQLKDLAAKPVTPDVLARAKQPLIEGQRKKLETNDYWIGKLSQMTREPRARDEALEELDNIQKVTAADVQTLAAKYVAGRQPIVAIARAVQSKAGGAGATSTGVRQ